MQMDSGITEGKKIEFLVQFDRVQQLSTMRFIFPPVIWKTLRFFNMGWERVLREDAIGLSNYVRNIIHKRRATGDFETADDLLAMYVRTGRNSGKAYMTDDDYLVDAILNFMIAGK
jgi:cytochrome P450